MADSYDAGMSILSGPELGHVIDKLQELPEFKGLNLIVFIGEYTLQVHVANPILYELSTNEDTNEIKH